MRWVNANVFALALVKQIIKHILCRDQVLSFIKICQLTGGETLLLLLIGVRVSEVLALFSNRVRLLG